MQTTDSLDQTARATAKAYMGAPAWPTALLGCFTTVGYLATALGVATGALSLTVALPVMIFLTYATYTVMHDAAHGSINGSTASLRWLNELMGYLAGQVLLIPLTAHRHEHLAHHRNTNQGDADPDHGIAEMTRSPLAAIRAGAGSIFSQYSYYLAHRWQVAPRSQNVRFITEIATALGWRLALIVLVAGEFWLETTLLFLLAGLGGVILLMYLFAYLVHKPHSATGRYLDTSTIIIPGRMGKLLTLLWGFQNYHSIHHLFPRVPFFKYRALFEDIEEIMVAKGAPVYHLGWSGLYTSQCTGSKLEQPHLARA